MAAKNNTATTVTSTEDKTEVKEKRPTKKKLKLGDDVLIAVKSNVFGKLIYINHKSGDETQWTHYGEVQSMTVGDLRAMKAKQLKFFKENWIRIDGIEDADEDYEGVELADIYQVLMVSQYYKDTICPEDINAVFKWSVSKIKENVPKMTASVKTAIIVRANDMIASGELDSLSKIRAIEEALSCELLSPNE